jgi:outer membrane receptor protein involved in Fe transport
MGIAFSHRAIAFWATEACTLEEAAAEYLLEGTNLGPILLPLAGAALIAGQPSTPAAGSPDTIIVTGERTKRNLRETASSVEVLTGRDVEASPADRVEQILKLIPNIQLGNGSEGPAIRSQDTTGGPPGASRLSRRQSSAHDADRRWAAADL